MTIDRLACTGELPGRWAAHGRRILEARQIDPDHYQSKVVKERLLDAMAVPNVLALIENARELDDLDSVEVMRRLVLDRGTPNRWLRDAVQPHARMFFGLLVMGLRREIGDVSLPGNRTVIWESVTRTMAIIREKELGGPRKRPKRADIACVRSLMRHADADLLAPPRDESSWEADQVTELLAEVADETRRSTRSGAVSAGDVLAAVREWAVPYVLFRLGLFEEWRMLDEVAV
jgi:hypothetical protein